MSQTKNIDKSDKSDFTKRIWKFCYQQGLTTTELAAQAGLHRTTVWYWLNGVQPSQKSLVKLYAIGFPLVMEERKDMEVHDPA